MVGIAWAIALLPGIAVAQETCFEPEDATGIGGGWAGRANGDHVSVRWNETVGIDPLEAQSLANAFDRAWSELEERGLRTPAAWPEHRLLAAIARIPGGETAGLTAVKDCDGQAQPWFLLNEDTVARPTEVGWPQNAGVLAAHELFHAAQFEYLGDDWPWEHPEGRWLMESTAAHFAWQVEPSHPVHAADSRGWLADPGRSLLESEGDAFEYGAWVIHASIDADHPGWQAPFWDEAELGDAVAMFDATLDGGWLAARRLLQERTLEPPEGLEYLGPLRIPGNSQSCPELEAGSCQGTIARRRTPPLAVGGHPLDEWSAHVQVNVEGDWPITLIDEGGVRQMEPSTWTEFADGGGWIIVTPPPGSTGEWTVNTDGCVCENGSAAFLFLLLPLGLRRATR